MKRFLKRAGSTLLVIAALGIGNLMLTLTPQVDTSQRPFLYDGKQGETVDTRTFKVTLLKTRTAAVIRSAGVEHDTQGIWVLVRIRAEASSESNSIRYAVLADAKGRNFRATDRIKQPLIDGVRMLQPGVPVEGEVVFEIPKDATGLTLRFTDAEVDVRMLGMTDIELPIGDAVWIDRDPVTPDAVEVRP